MKAAHIVFLCHPETACSTSMPRFASMLCKGMIDRSFSVDCWTAPALFSKMIPSRGAIYKWLGYIDSYLIFPVLLRRRLTKLGPNTLMVVTDNALGMWVSHIITMPHVVHCHDFLAQRSEIGEIPEHKTGPTGRIYQRLIRRGFRQGRNFISVSRKTREDLNRFLLRAPEVSEMVYNGLNYPFKPLDSAAAAAQLESVVGTELKQGYFLHVGGNQWYKNRLGVLKLYHHYSLAAGDAIPLVMVGAVPDRELVEYSKQLPSNGKVQFASGLMDCQVNAAYAGATALIFPSLEEGFGWPIVEAHASGCPVITTNLAPMTEVGGQAAWYLDRRQCLSESEDEAWAKRGAHMLKKISYLCNEERSQLVSRSIANSSRFKTEVALDRIENIYRSILAKPVN